MRVDNKEIAFVHFDTNFLAYGINGEEGNPKMKEYFKKYGWTDKEIFSIIER